MSNTTKNLKKRLKAPRELTLAVKRGERVTPRHKTDTCVTHIRRFSMAFVAYACAAALLIGGAAILPSLLDGTGTPAASGNSAPVSSVTDALVESSIRIDEEYDSQCRYGNDYYTGTNYIAYNAPIDSAKGELSVDISALPTAPTGDETKGQLPADPATFDDSMKATVIAKKVSSISYYHTVDAENDPITPAAYTVSTFEILSVEKDSDFYYSQPYEVGRTIKVIEWYAVAPGEDGNHIYRSYPYSYQGVEMPDLTKLDQTYRLTLIDGSALGESLEIGGAFCYESGMRPSIVIYLPGCRVIAGNVEEID